MKFFSLEMSDMCAKKVVNTITATTRGGGKQVIITEYDDKTSDYMIRAVDAEGNPVAW